jgi:hypothetical protein
MLDEGLRIPFEPGIRQLVKSHEPKFFSKIASGISRK